MRTKRLKFSPSHSQRWMNCPGALALCATLPEQASGKFAMEGTAAHELAANCLTNRQNADEWLGEVIEVEDSKFKVTEDMAENVQVYLDAVRGDMKADGVPHSELMVEVKAKTTFGSEAVGGTSDAVYSPPLGALRVYDYKHGAGTYVEVVENSQLMIYALGAWETAGAYHDEIELVVAQPRYRGDVEPVRRWKLTKEELLAFKEAVTLAIVGCKKKGAELVPGTWCSKAFCPAQGACPALKGQVEAAAGGHVTAVSLTPEGLAKVLENADMISGWVKAVREHAKQQAVDLGIEIPGYKVVQKWGNRAWIDELMVENEFEHEFGDKIYDKKVKSPAKIEKIVGKERVKELVERKNNGLDLVPEGAKGDAVDTRPVFKKINS